MARVSRALSPALPASLACLASPASASGHHLAPRPAVEQQILDDHAPAGGHPYPELGGVLPDRLPQRVPAVLGDEELLQVIDLPLRERGVAARRLVAGDLRHGG